MSDVVIRVEGVSKLYRLGEVGTGSLAHDVNRWWHRVRGKEDPYLKIGEVNDRTKPAKQARSEKNLTTEDTESTEVGAEARLGGQAGGAFPNPFTSKLASDSENTSLIRSANFPHSSEEQSDSKALATSYSPLVTPKAAPSDWVYALKDVSFDVKRGEVLGIIGRNGAGKSTLLKILSRVTGQTSGRIKVKGRIASLLEVGTGFHPELTGRENIFLNGAILGMRKAEIARKFDEIVEFSGCARYIDTPVKRYSSGMYVRLAFAVAAHLEPEILIVDEVLAVGDAEFQKKCLGKMKDVAGHGRTILFVSHNMASLSNLCTRGIYMNNGQMAFEGNIESCIQKYLHTSTKMGDKATGCPYNGLIKRVSVLNPDSNLPENHIDPAKPVEIQIEVDMGETEVQNPRIGIGINDQFGARVATVASYYSNSEIGRLTGRSFVRCTISSLPLAPGDYPLKVALSSETKDLEVLENEFRCRVLQTDFYNNGKLAMNGHGSLLIRSQWTNSVQ
jgi:lipopolysaccharide transport system ATP-binding protein